MAQPTEYQALPAHHALHEHGRPGGATTFHGNTDPVAPPRPSIPAINAVDRLALTLLPRNGLLSPV
jgi:hypothetical protein